ncbi:P-type ATPase, translocating [Thermoplasmatales archaeon SCGC AB-540-F20]|nr:P-type ATPase, translocating [Thermoplasmatales archaeon SCGC AB-540-F20]
MIKSPAKVFRDGDLIEISQINLVPGDIVKVEEGDKLPADIRIIEASGFKTNDFALTGESVPQEKITGAIVEEVSIADRINMAYAGTTVASGNAVGVVVATGMVSETGKIAKMTEETGVMKTPLQEEMRLLARQLTIAVVIIGVALFFIGIAQNFTFYLSLVYALGIAMALVPQALPAQVTVALSTGSSRLANRNAVVKNLPSVETLGSTTVICTDKTGTLTKNEMTVRSVWFSGKKYQITGLGYEPKGEIKDEKGKTLTQKQIDEIEVMMDTATMASNAEIHKPDDQHDIWYPIGDPTEAALVTMSTKLGTRSPVEDEENPEIQEFPFDSKRKRMSSVRKFGEQVALTVKGSTNAILSISKYIYKNGKEELLAEDEKKQIKTVSEQYSEEGLRVIAIARRDLEPQKSDYKMEEVEKDLIFLGLVGMIDPAKEGVKEAIKEACEAGIRIIMITGDHAITARAIGKDIGLSVEWEKDIFTGVELNEMDDNKLKKVLKGKQSIIFSRVDPADKLRIVKILEEEGEIVAVTGDGVNDAPALRRAHIGVSMGKRGTDVAKEASRLVLLDDSFPTLVNAIEEGRTIYTNLKKTVYSSLTTNIAELVLVLFGLLGVALWNYPIPILAVQVLAIDLIGEIMPLTFLTFDPPAEGVMTSPPRDPKEHMVNRSSATEFIFLGIMIGGLAFSNFFFFMQREGITLTVNDTNILPYFQVTALAYATIVFCQYINILEWRYDYTSIFNRNLFTNKILLGSIVVSIGLVLMAIYAPFISDFLVFSDLRISDWGLVGLATLIFLFVFEFLKVLRKKKLAKNVLTTS